MNVVPMGGIISGAAGTPLAQTGGVETERTQREGVVRERQAASETSAEKSAGVGTTDEDQETSERDADGRMFWEQLSPAVHQESQGQAKQSKDPTGESGNSLDLTG